MHQSGRLCVGILNASDFLDEDLHRCPLWVILWFVLMITTVYIQWIHSTSMVLPCKHTQVTSWPKPQWRLLLSHNKIQLISCSASDSGSDFDYCFTYIFRVEIYIKVMSTWGQCWWIWYYWNPILTEWIWILWMLQEVQPIPSKRRWGIYYQACMVYSGWSHNIPGNRKT